MAQFLTSRVQVLVHRSQMSEISRTAFVHELPLLREMYGDEEVRVIDAPDTELGGQVFLDAKAEWLRLSDIYGMHPERASLIVEHVFHNNISQMVAAANDYHEAAPQRISDEGMVSIEQVGPKNYGEIETLRSALKDLGVSFATNTGKAALADKLRVAALQQLKLHGTETQDAMELPEIMALLAAVEGGE